jgi:hypothetical protein
VDEIDADVVLARFVLEAGYVRVVSGEADNPIMLAYGQIRPRHHGGGVGVHHATREFGNANEDMHTDELGGVSRRPSCFPRP